MAVQVAHTKRPSGITRAQVKRQLREHYHQSAKRFANKHDSKVLTANGQSVTKSRFGFGLLMPPHVYYEKPIDRLLPDRNRKPYTRAEIRSMHHGTYRWS